MSAQRHPDIAQASRVVVVDSEVPASGWVTLDLPRTLAALGMGSHDDGPPVVARASLATPEALPRGRSEIRGALLRRSSSERADAIARSTPSGAGATADRWPPAASPEPHPLRTHEPFESVASIAAPAREPLPSPVPPGSGEGRLLFTQHTNAAGLEPSVLLRGTHRRRRIPEADIVEIAAAQDSTGTPGSPLIRPAAGPKALGILELRGLALSIAAGKRLIGRYQAGFLLASMVGGALLGLTIHQTHRWWTAPNVIVVPAPESNRTIITLV